MARKKVRASSQAAKKVKLAREDQISHFFRTHKSAKWLLPLLVFLTVIYLFRAN